MTLDWSTRGALRLYPQRWRDEFEQEVIGTLLDVAEAEQSQRPPLRELIPLAVRGAWLRARSSVAFWVGLVIIAVMLFTLGQTFDGFLSERYWPVMLSRAGMGLMLALPLAGASVAWQTGRRRAKRPLPQRMRELLGDVAAPAAFVAIGYLAAVGAQIAASGWPVTTTTDLRSTLVYFCMLLAALAVGGLVGTIVRAVVAAPITWIALSLWYLLPLSFEEEVGNLSGSWLLIRPLETLGDALAPTPFAVVSLTAAVLAVLAVALTIVKVTRGWLWFGAIFALVAVAVSVNARSVTGWWPDDGVANRTDELVCAGDAPRICLWPEQEAASGELVRSTLSDAYEKALTLGIPVPSDIGIYYRLSASPDQLIANYSETLIGQFGCDLSDHPDLGFMLESSDDRIRAELSAGFALAFYLGADPSTVWTIQTGGDASGPAENTLGLDEMKDYFNVHDETEVKAAVLAWAERGPTCE